MSEPDELRERTKELRCLYSIHDILRERARSPVQAFFRVVEAIPAGLQRPAAAGARIEYLGRSYVGPGFFSVAPRISESIRVWGTDFGCVEVSDASDPEGQADRVFLPEEGALLRNIAARLGEYLEWKQTELLGGLPTAALHWQWRESYVQALGANLDRERFGVEALYLGGSTEAGDAGPGSDIDLYVVTNGSDPQRRELVTWLEGWSECLAEVARQQTGYPFSRGILDVHWLERPPGIHERFEMREVALSGHIVERRR
jgi:predicted nucleotidyltransferase